MVGKSGNLCKKNLILYYKYTNKVDNNDLLGEYPCKIDSKGRMRVPSALLREIGISDEMESSESNPQVFVLNRGFEKNLVLRPKAVWDSTIAKFSALNQFNRKNRKAVRYMYRGAQKLELDASGRILLKKQLLDFAGIDKEVTLFAQGDTVEIWATDIYNETFNEEADEDMAAFIEEVMGAEEPGQKEE